MQLGMHYLYNTNSIGVYNSIHKVTAVSYIQYTSEFEYYTLQAVLD